MAKTSKTNDGIPKDPASAQRDAIKAKIISQTILKVHIIAFIFVNLILILINMVLTNGSYLWFPWALTGWGLGLIIHIFSYIGGYYQDVKINYNQNISIHEVSTNLSVKARTAGPKTAGLMSYHIFLYIVVNLYLTFIDWYSDGRIGWVYWPVIGWGIGLLLHIIFYSMFKGEKPEDKTKSWIDRKVDAELAAKGISNLSTSDDIICKKCQSSNPKTAEFCANCGEKF